MIEQSEEEVILSENQELDTPAFRVQRLQGLLELAALPVRSIKVSRVAVDVVASLDACASVFHRLSPEGKLEITALHQRGNLDDELLEDLATRAADEIFSTGAKMRVDNISEHFAREEAADVPSPISYLGVPLFNSTGVITGITGVMSTEGRQFDAEDEWWLETTAHIVSSGIACESLELRLERLEELQSSPVSASQYSITDNSKPGASRNIARTRTILLVDDDREVNSVVRKFLIRRGYEVDSAFDGLEALRMFRPGEHEVIISDVMMPHMNGWELVAALRARTTKLAIFLITGYSQIGGMWNRSFLQQQGVSTILTKPIDFDFLADTLEDAFRIKRF
jgi:CheY-like chemotaxis protein